MLSILYFLKLKEDFTDDIIYKRAANRNYIYYEPAVANALNTNILTSKEILALRKKKEN